MDLTAHISVLHTPAQQNFALCSRTVVNIMDMIWINQQIVEALGEVVQDVKRLGQHPFLCLCLQRVQLNSLSNH